MLFAFKEKPFCLCCLSLSAGAISQAPLSNHLITTLRLFPLTSPDRTKAFCESNFPSQFLILSQPHCVRFGGLFPWLRAQRPLEGPVPPRFPTDQHLSWVLHLSASLLESGEREPAGWNALATHRGPRGLSLHSWLQR